MFKIVEMRETSVDLKDIMARLFKTIDAVS